MKILLVEDSKHLCTYLTKAFKREGHTVDIAEDGEQGLWQAQSFRYDVMVLDVMLPKLDGFEIITELRKGGNPIHILLLTAKDTKTEVVKGLKLGADDYMVKPFDLDELVARVEALGRRAQVRKSPLVHVGPLSLDTERKEILANGITVSLPQREFKLLSYLVINANQVISRSTLEEQIYDMNQNVMSNSVNSAISIIRKELTTHGCQKMIQTRRGLGYILSTEYDQ